MGILPKLEVGDVNDPLERQADAIADRVLRMPAPSRESLDRPTPEPDSELDGELEDEELSEAPTGGAFAGGAALPGGPGLVAQRKCAACETEAEQPDEIHRSVADPLLRRKCETCEDEDEIRRACASCDLEEEEPIRREPAANPRVAATDMAWTARTWVPAVRRDVRRPTRPATPSTAFGYDRQLARTECTACEGRPRNPLIDWMRGRNDEACGDPGEIRRACASCDAEGDEEIMREPAAAVRGGPT
ncbi:MAG TPA: hypothetical protein VK034_26635, partial [Enhygromyxa sp.]|nr:hypothetical protein [Enhygromyxa sp.]